MAEMETQIQAGNFEWAKLVLEAAQAPPAPDQDEAAQADSVDQLNGAITQCTAYLRTEGTPLQSFSEGQLALVLYRQNKDFRPSHVVKISRDGTFRLVWRTSAERDAALAHGLSHDGTQLALQLPDSNGAPRRTYFKTIFLSGIPLVAPMSFVKSWISEKLDCSIKPGTDVRFCTFPGTDIQSGTRSAVVEVEIGKEIPGFATMFPPTGSALSIRVNYKGRGLWCNYCKGRGHLISDCEVLASKESRKGPRGAGEALQHADRRNARGAGEALQHADRRNAHEYRNRPARHQRPLPPGAKRSGTLDSKYGDNIYGFFTKRYVFSNHYPCQIVVNDRTFESTEHFLFVSKAEEMNDDIALLGIEKVKEEANKVKIIGDRVPWRNHSARWEDFAVEKLLIANEAKYRQNPELRKELFASHGKRLAECSLDRFWGTSIHISKEDQWCKLENWPE